MAKLLTVMILLAGAMPIAPMPKGKLPMTAVPMVAVFTTANVTYSSNIITVHTNM